MKFNAQAFFSVALSLSLSVAAGPAMAAGVLRHADIRILNETGVAATDFHIRIDFGRGASVSFNDCTPITNPPSRFQPCAVAGTFGMVREQFTDRGAAGLELRIDFTQPQPALIPMNTAADIDFWLNFQTDVSYRVAEAYWTNNGDPITDGKQPNKDTIELALISRVSEPTTLNLLLACALAAAFTRRGLMPKVKPR